jgi:hypothetical protein
VYFGNKSSYLFSQGDISFGSFLVNGLSPYS